MVVDWPQQGKELLDLKVGSLTSVNSNWIGFSSSTKGDRILGIVRIVILLLVGLTLRTAFSQGCCTDVAGFAPLNSVAQVESGCCDEEKEHTADTHPLSAKEREHCPSPCCGAFVVTKSPTIEMSPIEIQVSSSDYLLYPEIHLAAPTKPPIV